MRDSIDELLRRAEGYGEDPEALLRIIEELERRLAAEKTSELGYACAYAWYLHPRRLTTPSIGGRVDELLQCVLRARPDDYLALLYLGHNAYDRGNLADARGYFEAATRVAPRDYIGLKSFEMVVCCDVRARGLAAALPAVRAYVLETERHDYAAEDVWPQDLARALQQTSTQHAEPSEVEEMRKLAARLDEAGGLNGWLSAAWASASASARG